MAKLKMVTGAQEIIARLRVEDVRLGHKVQKGLTRAGLLLQRESQKITPVDTGNLKNSAFTRRFGSGWASMVVVGFTAAYAVYVHERTDLQHKKGKEAKFLEKAMKRNWPQLLEVIAGRSDVL